MRGGSTEKKNLERGEDLSEYGNPASYKSGIGRSDQCADGISGPFTMKEQLPNLFRHWICRALLAYLEMAAGDRSRKNFLEIMNRPNRYIARDALTEKKLRF